MTCLICQPPESCKGYPHLWKRLREDPERWRRVHDQVNLASSPETAPQALAVSQSDPWLPLIRACPDHNPGCCAHPAAFCTRFSGDTTREQCVACLTADGIGPAPEP